MKQPSASIAMVTCLVLACFAPIVLLWPAAALTDGQSETTHTRLPRTGFTVTGAALRSPLLTAGRSPAPKQAVTPATLLASPAPELVGVVTNRHKAIALVKSGAGDTVTVTPGEVVDGWSVVEVRLDHVVLEQGGRRVTVTLDFNSHARAKAAQASVAVETLPISTK